MGRHAFHANIDAVTQVNPCRSTGTPKGVLHTVGGYMVWAATTFKYIFDTRPSAAHYHATNVYVPCSRAAPRPTGCRKVHAHPPYHCSGMHVDHGHHHHGHHGHGHGHTHGHSHGHGHTHALAPDVHFCTADIGWVTGHSYILYGPLLNGTHTLLFEGTPTYPGPDRLWDVVAKHRATTLYTAPTAIRALMVHGDAPVRKHDLSSLRILGSVGEPINPEAWRWYHNVVGGGRLPIVDTWWQTETGACI